MGTVLNRRIGVSRPLPPGEEAQLAVAVAAGDLGSVVEEILAEAGLTPRQHNVLRMLRGAGARGLSHSEIAERILARAPDVTRIMDRLVDRGWVLREQSPDDRRVVHHRLTASGEEVLETLAAPLARHHRAVAEVLGPGKVETLVALCESLIEAVADRRLAAPRADREGA